jgi:hypothetical protein
MNEIEVAKRNYKEAVQDFWVNLGATVCCWAGMVGTALHLTGVEQTGGAIIQGVTAVFFWSRFQNANEDRQNRLRELQRIQYQAFHARIVVKPLWAADGKGNEWDAAVGEYKDTPRPFIRRP